MFPEDRSGSRLRPRSRQPAGVRAPGGRPRRSGDAPDARRERRSLIVLPGARDVTARPREGGAGSATACSVDVPGGRADPGPVAKRLERRGWIRARRKPAQTAGRRAPGWTSFVGSVRGAPIRCYNWWSEWTNVGGDHVATPSSTRGRSTRRGTAGRLGAGGFYPARLALTLKEEATLAAERSRKSASGGGRTRDRASRASDGAVRATGDLPAVRAGGRGRPFASRHVRRPGRVPVAIPRPAGSKSSGSAPEASLLRRVPIGLLWFPRVPVARRARVDAAPEEPRRGAVGLRRRRRRDSDPGEQFEASTSRRRAPSPLLLPERNRGRRPAAASESVRPTCRRDAILERASAGRSSSDRALLVQGPEGSGVIEIVAPGMESVTYRWRLPGEHGVAATSRGSGGLRAAVPGAARGPYSMQWQARSDLRGCRRKPRGARRAGRRT
jgi:hypothetical protein